MKRLNLSKKLHGDEATADGDDDTRMAKTIERSSDIPKVAEVPTAHAKEAPSNAEEKTISNVKTSTKVESSKQKNKGETQPKKVVNTKEKVVKPKSEETTNKPSSKSKKTNTKPVGEKSSEKKESKQKAKTNLPKHAKEDNKLGLIYSERPVNADDLTKIKGVGPVLEEKLNKFGVYTFNQISHWSPEIVSEFDDLLSFKGRIDRDEWLTQAKDLDANKTK